MLFTIIFTAFGLLACVAAGVLLYFRKKALDNTAAMSATETSPARSVAGAGPGTTVEVKGTLKCEEPLTGEMSGETCAYYKSQVIREYRDTDRDADGDTRTRHKTEVVASNERFAPFAVEDGSGRVEVRAEEAEVDALRVVERFEQDAGGGGITLGGMRFDFGHGERTIGYRYVESVLPVDKPVYVLGAVGGDGRISAAGEGRFLVSYRSEEQLEKKYRKDARTLAVVAAGLFVFGLIFIAVGVGSAVV
ncbi:E3 Ubiquitin ligase [Rubrobacter radiotolerans]|uniref:RING-type E3 ubiquitin transferase n=1 Tax=Rubrobacter radiotolerans TaxID=42256 RepID=A0A023X6U1_RUBRA|nr:E3 ubiquitin ligase family protein [Rubrobacter radiotolerans]AHY47936.1 E3 Ubiquitin ligase [Rubrobacter radiotolerans]MDX5892575.1 E3 ubiquitin ligase family protein [Rubrobacter radiotolerans]SMC07864.1 E3 Ubiquitin ligase [Rubrobacter radiotolerans DSM 5868]